MSHWGSSFINFKLGDGRGEYKLPVYIQVSGLKKIVSEKHFPCFLRGILNKVVMFLHLFTLSSAEVSMSFTVSNRCVEDAQAETGKAGSEPLYRQLARRIHGSRHLGTFKRC